MMVLFYPSVLPQPSQSRQLLLRIIGLEIADTIIKAVAPREE